MWDLLFIGLVFLDGWLTQRLLAIGATEANPNPFVLWSVQHLWVRILVAITIVLLLRYFDKSKLLKPLSFVCLGICIYNGLMLILGKTAIWAMLLFG